MSEVVIGLDLGTTNAKALALDSAGNVLATASSGYAIHASRPGWGAQNPQAVWNGACIALHDLVSKLDGVEIAGLSLSGAMHSCFPIGSGNCILAPAMTWADQRAAQNAERLRSECDPGALYQRTGCPLQPIYHIPKIRWWVENTPELLDGLLYFVTIKDYVLYRLTGIWAADRSIYSATGLLDLHSAKWDDEALSLAGVKADKLPPLVSPQDVVGAITLDTAAKTGLPVGLSVVAGASDGGLANLGTGAARPGDNIITIGTSGAVRRVVAEPYLDPQKPPRTWCYLLRDGRYFAGGAINNAGLALQWIREKFYPDLEGQAGYERLIADAAQMAPGSGGVLLLPFFAGERSPYWRADARGSIHGLGLEHDRRHIARAVLEAVAYRLGTIWEALGESSDQQPVRLTGGIVGNATWAQIISDVIGMPLAAVEGGDASAIGAAMLGQVSLGLADSLDELAARIQPGTSWQPDPARHTFYQEQLIVYKDLYQRLYG